MSEPTAETTRLTLSGWLIDPALERFFECSRFRAIRVFDTFGQFRASGLKISLCFQIARIPFAFSSIKRRMILVPWKVVTVSGAGRLCTSDTV